MPPNPLYKGLYKRTWQLADGSTRTSPTYHYRRRIAGVSYSGDTGQTTLRDAAAYLRDVVLPAIQAQTTTDLHRQRERVITATAGSITLATAWTEFRQIPRASANQNHTESINASWWGDFTQYMRDNHPTTQLLSEVTDAHTSAYYTYITTHGRWLKTSTYPVTRNGRTHTRTRRLHCNKLAAATTNHALVVIRMVFDRLRKRANLPDNPTRGLPYRSVKRDAKRRRIFSVEQVTAMQRAAEPPLRNLVLIAPCTGLSLADICLLRWRDLDLPGNTIAKRREKTGEELRIPMLPAVRERIRELHAAAAHPDYVFPDLAQLYRTTPVSITRQFKTLCQAIGIEEPSVRYEDRDHASSLYDIHSFRHTTAYLLGVHGVPLPVVQQILGHMSPRMTEHYMMHANDRERADAMQQLPDFFGTPAADPIDQLLSDLTADQKQALLQRLLET
jgi:integrase